ncbi:MAG: hypothetical protein WDA65_05895 [Christensenellales bacterium]
MEKIKDKRTFLAAIGVSALLLLGAIVLAVSVSPSALPVFWGGGGKTARLTVLVVEGYTETPIADAAVVVVETGKTYKTDTVGLTQIIEVPVIKDTRYDKILQKPWGEITLIIYKEGFIPYALFYLQVLEGQTREGVKILLFEHDKTPNTPFSIIEGPSRIWVNALVEKYQPDY